MHEPEPITTLPFRSFVAAEGADRELFRRIGYRLNQGRIKKRTDDYLCDLLEREAEHGGA